MIFTNAWGQRLWAHWCLCFDDSFSAENQGTKWCGLKEQSVDITVSAGFAWDQHTQDFKLQLKPYCKRLKGSCTLNRRLHLPLISRCLNQRMILRNLPNTRGRMHYRLSYVTSQMCRYKSSVLVRLSCTLMFSPGLQWRDLMLFFLTKINRISPNKSLSSMLKQAASVLIKNNNTKPSLSSHLSLHHGG